MSVCSMCVHCAGHIGHTSPTPCQMALGDYIRRKSLYGFVGANYTFGSEVTEDGEVTSGLKEVESRDALISRLEVPPYDGRTFKFWCYDTPGLINPDQVCISRLNQHLTRLTAGLVVMR